MGNVMEDYTNSNGTEAELIGIFIEVVGLYESYLSESKDITEFKDPRAFSIKMKHLLILKEYLRKNNISTAKRTEVSNYVINLVKQGVMKKKSDKLTSKDKFYYKVASFLSSAYLCEIPMFKETYDKTI
jgi:hypothetical protein